MAQLPHDLSEIPGNGGVDRGEMTAVERNCSGPGVFRCLTRIARAAQRIADARLGNSPRNHELRDRRVHRIGQRLDFARKRGDVFAVLL